MRVAYVLGTSDGGTGRHVAMLARGFCAPVFGPAGDFGFGSFTQVDIGDRPRPWRDLRCVARLRRLLRGFDVVHAHGLRAGVLCALALTPVRRRPALAVTVHNAPPAAGSAALVYRLLERVVARRAAAVLCVSPDLEARMRAAGARHVAAAVVPAVITTPVAGSAGASFAAQGRPVVFAAGRLAEQKGFGVLLEAATAWRDLTPPPKVVIAGDGPLRASLEARAAALGADVAFLGRRPDVPALLAAADVFVLPSLWEGQPLVLQEALRAGVPVVATRAGGIPALAGAVSCGDGAALLVPPGDPAALAAAVRRVLGDPVLAGRLRAAARARARALPDEAAALAAVRAEYERLAGPGG